MFWLDFEVLKDYKEKKKTQSAYKIEPVMGFEA